MEYCHSGSIGSKLKERGALKEEIIREIVTCCLFGLYYLHKQNIVHRVVCSWIDLIRRT